MSAFRRTLRFLFTLAGVGAGVVTAIAFFFSRLLVAPPRQRIWGTPADIGLDYEAVQFPATDGARLAGWFIPAKADSLRKGATIVLVHGWPWNRLGDAAEDMFSNLNGATPVDLLRLALHLHNAGFHLLMFDLRNHGESASMPPVTLGLTEARDVVGALNYVNGRSDVSSERVGVVGFSMGANATFFAIEHSDAIKAAVAVQPTTPVIFAERYATYLLGPIGKVILPLAQLFYKLQGGISFDQIRPISAAANAEGVPVLVIQGNGDAWGSVTDAEQIAAVLPNGSAPIIAQTDHRYGGYQYLVDRPEIVVAFFEQHFPE